MPYRKTRRSSEQIERMKRGRDAARTAMPLEQRPPERKAETERNFAAQLDAAGPMALIDGTETGPYPAEHNPDASNAIAKRKEARK